jgi:hypothetical protein
MSAHTKGENATAPHGISDPIVVCKLPTGGNVTMPLSECIHDYNGQPVGDIRDPIFFDAESLFPYRLPSGKEVVGTHQQCAADRGALVEGFDSRVIAPSRSGSPELFVCQLPSGLGVVMTYDQCQRDGGTVVGKLECKSEPIPG